MSNFDVWCPDCGCLMKLRNGKYGEFYGCTGYPICRNTMNKRDAALDHDPSNTNCGYTDQYLEPPDGSD